MISGVVPRSEELVALLAVRADRVSNLFKVFLGFQVEIKLLDTVEEAATGVAVLLQFLELSLLLGDWLLKRRKSSCSTSC